MRKIRLRQVYFIITRTCNLFCSHCIRSSGPSVKETVDLEQALHVIREIARTHQDPTFIISGGEPTLHRDFFDILKEAHTNFSHVMVNTNGLNTQALLKIASKFPNTHIQISLDGDEKTHNLIRGAGTFKKTLQNISLISERKIRVTVATTAGKGNVNSFYDLDKSLEHISFSDWTIKREVVYGRANSKNAQTTEDWNEFVYSTENFINRERIKINPMFELASFIPQELHEGFQEERCNCGTGRSKIYINPNLTVFPCACLEELEVANLKTQSIEEVLDSLKQLSIDSKMDSPCRKCPVFERCQGGCPGASLHTFGSFGVGDPRCPAINDLVGDKIVE